MLRKKDIINGLNPLAHGYLPASASKIPELTNFKYKLIGLENPAFRLLRLLKGDDIPTQGQISESKRPPNQNTSDIMQHILHMG